MFDKKFNIEIKVGKGSMDYPEYINGVTVQCKNCLWWGKSGHCGVMPSERFEGESWCMTKAPKQFFMPKPKGERENEI